MTYSIHDEALIAISGASPEVRNGAPNHAPMIVETLAALGRGEAAPAWIEAYRPRLAKGRCTTRPRSARTGGPRSVISAFWGPGKTISAESLAKPRGGMSSTAGCRV